MKNLIFWIPAVFVLGGLVGLFGPQEELRAYRKTADADASARIAPSANGFDSFAALANIPTAASRSRLAEPSCASAATSDASAVGAAEARGRLFSKNGLRAFLRLSAVASLLAALLGASARPLHDSGPSAPRKASFADFDARAKAGG